MGPAQRKRQSVLIVEDDAELRRLMVALLEDEQLDTAPGMRPPSPVRDSLLGQTITAAQRPDDRRQALASSQWGDRQRQPRPQQPMGQ